MGLIISCKLLLQRLNDLRLETCDINPKTPFAKADEHAIKPYVGKMPYLLHRIGLD